MGRNLVAFNHLVRPVYREDTFLPAAAVPANYVQQRHQPTVAFAADSMATGATGLELAVAEVLAPAPGLDGRLGQRRGEQARSDVFLSYFSP